MVDLQCSHQSKSEEVLSLCLSLLSFVSNLGFASLASLHFALMPYIHALSRDHAVALAEAVKDVSRQVKDLLSMPFLLHILSSSLRFASLTSLCFASFRTSTSLASLSLASLPPSLRLFRIAVSYFASFLTTKTKPQIRNDDALENELI